MIKSCFATVCGTVQGVGFRYSAINKARSLNLRGWVKNEINGTVSTRFEGFSENVDIYINWLKRGPSAAIVKEVILDELTNDEKLGLFHAEF